MRTQEQIEQELDRHIEVSRAVVAVLQTNLKVNELLAARIEQLEDAVKKLYGALDVRVCALEGKPK